MTRLSKTFTFLVALSLSLDLAPVISIAEQHEVVGIPIPRGSLSLCPSVLRDSDIVVVVVVVKFKMRVNKAFVR